VGPEGVKPSPRRVKAGHASLHLDPVLLSLLLLFAFAFHGHTSSDHLVRDSDTPLAMSALALFTHLLWARLELNQLATTAQRLQRRSLPGDEPRALKRRKPPRFHRAAFKGKTLENTPLRHLLLIAPRGETMDNASPGFARAKHRVNG